MLFEKLIEVANVGKTKLICNLAKGNRPNYKTFLYNADAVIIHMATVAHPEFIFEIINEIGWRNRKM